MNPERIEIVTDTGSSMKPDDEQVKQLGVHILPLRVIFSQDGKVDDLSDLDMTSEELYSRMRGAKQLPTTSGSVTGGATEIYEKLAKETDSILSVHVTSEHSTVCDSANAAAREVKEKYPYLKIIVVDSKSISLGTWFLVEQAADMAQHGAKLTEIEEALLNTRGKIELIAAFRDLKNALKGGRLHLPSQVANFLGNKFGNISAVVRLSGVDGKIKLPKPMPSETRARWEIVKELQREKREIVKIGVVHTNVPEIAEEMKTKLSSFISSNIPISKVEAGPALSVHGGEGLVAFIYQTK